MDQALNFQILVLLILVLQVLVILDWFQQNLVGMGLVLDSLVQPLDPLVWVLLMGLGPLVVVELVQVLDFLVLVEGSLVLVLVHQVLASRCPRSSVCR